MWLNPTAFWRSGGNGSLRQVLSSRNSRIPFVGSVMAGIIAPVTASRTIGSSSGPMSVPGPDSDLGARNREFRGRDASYLAPPAQIRTGPIRAYGSHLGCLTAKRLSGHG